ncbi:MAG: GMC family oxidoreductase [Actinomycetota bacterium]|nr:GMC family oxidoreductase [Actinomycetota bacterium]
MSAAHHDHDHDHDYDHDVLIVGSGFGGSVSAMRLTEKGYRVAVIEAGRRFGPDDYPRTNWNLRRFLFAPKLGLRGIQRMNLLGDALVLSGAGVGGGSLVYANTLYEPLDQFFDDVQWRDITDWRSELAPHYDQAKRMLGADRAPDQSPADDVLRAVGETLGVGDTYRATEVAVYLGDPGESVPDPYFGGRGPARAGCLQCGACMIGCRHEAKNSLDKNYLHLAETAGAQVLAERTVVDIEPLTGGGYAVTTERSGAWLRHRRQRHTVEQVILSAGVLGTVKLLASLGERGRLTGLSPSLGSLVRTNSESIVGATARDATVDHSVGVAISSSIYPNDHTHIEGVRYPKGSNALGLLATLLVDGGGKGSWSRPLRFLRTIVRQPITFARSLSVRRWSERSVILLVMQSRDNSLRLTWKHRDWKHRHRKHRRSGRIRLRSEQGTGEPNPTYIPEANAAARATAQHIGGDAMGSFNEALLDTPVTAHILGGCVIGADPTTGVVDAYQRVHGHPGLHIADASTISANLGVNPSLTICAQTERAMSMWPNRGDPDRRPAAGERYRSVAPVAPHHPIVPSEAPAALRG